MKRKIIGLVLILLLFAVSADAVMVVADKVTTGGSILNPLKMTVGGATDIDTAGGTVFTAFRVTTNSWILYIKNTGAQPLTDLEINLLPEPEYPTVVIEAIASAASITHLESTCVTNLATTVVCVVASIGGAPYGYLEVTATASDANKTNLQIILLEIP